MSCTQPASSRFNVVISDKIGNSHNECYVGMKGILRLLLLNQSKAIAQAISASFMAELVKSDSPVRQTLRAQYIEATIRDQKVKDYFMPLMLLPDLTKHLVALVLYQQTFCPCGCACGLALPPLRALQEAGNDLQEIANILASAARGTCRVDVVVAEDCRPIEPTHEFNEQIKTSGLVETPAPIKGECCRTKFSCSCHCCIGGNTRDRSEGDNRQQLGCCFNDKQTQNTGNLSNDGNSAQQGERKIGDIKFSPKE